MTSIKVSPTNWNLNQFTMHNAQFTMKDDFFPIAL